jgi:predicted naringenin-chalcone synthase
VGRIVEGSGIDKRHGVLLHAPPEKYAALLAAPGARGALWDDVVPSLAVAAARDALAGWRWGDARDVTHVVVHSCTGFAAPGLDFAVIEALGLRSDTRRLGVNFMGWCGRGARAARRKGAARGRGALEILTRARPRPPTPPPPQLWRHDRALRREADH